MLLEMQIYQKLASQEITQEEAKELLSALKAGEKFDTGDNGNPQENSWESVQEKIVEVMSKVLHEDKDEIGVRENMTDLGVDSINAAEIIYEINSVFGTNLDTTVIYDYVTIEAMSKYIAGLAIMKPVYENEKSDTVTISPVSEEPEAIIEETMLKGSITEDLIEIISELLHIDVEDITEDMTFSELGVDSINGVEIVKAINDAFQTNLDTVSLYDYSTIKNLSGYLNTEIQKNAVYTKKQVKKPEKVKQPEKKVQTEPVVPKKQPEESAMKKSSLQMKKSCKCEEQPTQRDVATGRIKLKKTSRAVPSKAVEETITKEQKTVVKETVRKDVIPKQEEQDIAVIGIACRYPKTMNKEELWDNLKNGICAIDKVPDTRWKGIKKREYYGGFLDQIDQFDPAFFNITPMEAELMDPQQRIFLQETYAALEDAGYSDRALSEMKCGVYVGATQGDYVNELQKCNLQNNMYSFTGLNTFILTGRISYLLNLKGPNMSIDTACSSSLVAIKEACDSLKSGESELAVAGGVRLMVTSDLHEQLDELGMLSEDGLCHAFDDNASGMVLGEGAGVVVLKRLDDALRDRDHIYGVIKKYAMNQDGKTNGMLAPSGQSQYELESQIYNETDMRADSISYVEASCTGTRLGDAIELKALKRKFEEFTDKENFCALGSVKANLGHTVMASGVASVIKVLLSMEHKQLTPAVNYEKPNQEVDLVHSPFYVNTELKDWTTQNQNPRRAAVSSFGISGTNCYMVLEENQPASLKTSKQLPYYLIVLSAKTESALKKKKEELISWITAGGKKDSELGDIAYTLLNGRSMYRCRFACVVSSVLELVNKLTGTVVAGESEKEQVEGFFKELTKDPSMKEEDYKFRLEAVRDAFINGVELDWDLLYKDAGFHKLSMPTYPFETQAYWVEAQEVEKKDENAGSYQLDELIHRNTSTVFEQKFISRFSGEEPFMEEHKINGKRVLPAVAYLEMAREAGTQSIEREVHHIGDIVWSTPYAIEDGVEEIKTTIIPEDDTVLNFEICSNTGNDPVVYCQGRIWTDDEENEEEIDKQCDLAAIRKNCQKEITGEEFYGQFKANGLYLGETMHSIQKINWCNTELISELAVKKPSMKDQQIYRMPISLMDGIVESTIMLIKEQEFNENAVYMPFALDSLDIIDEIPENCVVHICYQEDIKPGEDDFIFHGKILDLQGNTIAILHKLWVRAVALPQQKEIPEEQEKKMTKADILSLLQQLIEGKVDITHTAQRIGGLLDE